MTCLFILSPLPLQRKSKKRSFNSFKIWSFDWREDKRWFTWEAARLFRTVIFPMTLSLRADQQPRVLRIFSIFSEKLRVTVSFESIDSQTPSTFTFVFCQFKFRSGTSFSSLPAHEPIHRASVFLALSLRPDTLLKLSRIPSASVRDLSEPSSMRVVSSAYWLIRISVSLTDKPLMNGFFRIALARISAERTKRYGESGQPCRTPCGQKKSRLPSRYSECSFPFYDRF